MFANEYALKDEEHKKSTPDGFRAYLEKKYGEEFKIIRSSQPVNELSCLKFMEEICDKNNADQYAMAANLKMTVLFVHYAQLGIFPRNCLLVKLKETVCLFC